MMSKKDRKKIFIRFIKEIGLYGVFKYDYHGPGKVRSIEKTIDVCIENCYRPCEMINYVFYWSETSNEILWQSLYKIMRHHSFTWDELLYDMSRTALKTKVDLINSI